MLAMAVLFRSLWRKLLKIERTLLVRGDHVEQAVVVHINHFELRADATVVVDLMRRPDWASILAL